MLQSLHLSSYVANRYGKMQKINALEMSHSFGILSCLFTTHTLQSARTYKPIQLFISFFMKYNLLLPISPPSLCTLNIFHFKQTKVVLRVNFLEVRFVFSLFILSWNKLLQTNYRYCSRHYMSVSYQRIRESKKSWFLFVILLQREIIRYHQRSCFSAFLHSHHR